MADFEQELSDGESEVGSVVSDGEINSNGGFKLKNKMKKQTDDDEDDDEKEGGADDDDDDDDEKEGGADDDDSFMSEIDKDDDDIEGVSVDYSNKIDDLDQNNELNDDLVDGEDDEDDDDDEDYLKKFDENLQQNIIQEHHPELRAQNYEEIESLCTIVRDAKGNIVDPLHKTIPFISKYEKARVLGERAKQLDAGANSFIEDLDPTIIDGYMIALKEFEEKKIPFIIQRPLPNGACEYWRLKDLDVLA